MRPATSSACSSAAPRPTRWTSAGHSSVGETVLLLVNGGARTHRFVLPALSDRGGWEEIVNTARGGSRPVREGAVNLVAHSLMLLRHRASG